MIRIECKDKECFCNFQILTDLFINTLRHRPQCEAHLRPQHALKDQRPGEIIRGVVAKTGTLAKNLFKHVIDTIGVINTSILDIIHSFFVMGIP